MDRVDVPSPVAVAVVVAVSDRDLELSGSVGGNEPRDLKPLAEEITAAPALLLRSRLGEP